MSGPKVDMVAVQKQMDEAEEARRRPVVNRVHALSRAVRLAQELGGLLRTIQLDARHAGATATEEGCEIGYGLARKIEARAAIDLKAEERET